jgi:cytochrome c-type biogenesis protein
LPLALALVAGALASVNPCGFPLLPAFLSFYVGAEAAALPRAPARVAQGLLVGLLVAAGFLGVFAIVGIPIAYGVTQLTSAIPWAGLGIGILMAVAALVRLAGRAVYLSNRFRLKSGPQDRRDLGEPDPRCLIRHPVTLPRSRFRSLLRQTL